MSVRREMKTCVVIGVPYFSKIWLSYYSTLIEMFDHYRRPAHMLTISARASLSGLHSLYNIYIIVKLEDKGRILDKS